MEFANYKLSGEKCRQAVRSGSRRSLPGTLWVARRSGPTRQVGEFLRNSRAGWHPRFGETRLRRGLTLIELLITITIIAILAGMILGVASVAGETAREAHSRHMVTRLHNLLMEQWETYKTRRVTVDVPSGTPGQVNAALRLSALRQLMRMEMPDRWSDVVAGKVASNLPGQSLGSYPSFILPLSNPPGGSVPVARTGLGNIYLRRYAALKTTDPKTIRQNQGAECLYMVITIACGDGEARTLFHESNIGDTDGDGAPEFLDGWDRPINFVRWPFGFDSQSDIMTGDPVNDHDPFDVFRVHPQSNVDPRPGARLVPLIASAGRDGLFDLLTDTPDDFVYGTVNASFQTRAGNYTVPIVNPYVTGPSFQMADEFDTDNDGAGENGDGSDNYADNIHNHMLGER